MTTTASTVGESRDAAAGLDPVLMAVIANRLDAIGREMTNTLFRAGRSAILNTAKDFSCCIIAANDELLSSADGLQIHSLGSGAQTAWMRKLHPDLAEGDAFLHNDPYLGNTHAADHTVLIPVFVDGEHWFTSSTKAHLADIGNSQPSTYMPFARDVYEEGALVFPCARVQRGYAHVEDVIRMCRSRIRVPDVWYGDYLAMLGAARIGERRLKELVAKYGRDTVRRFVREWLDYSERRMVHALERLPAGTLQVEARHDPLPGQPDGIPVRVRVEVRPAEGLVEVDLRDNVDCVPLGVNLSETCARTAALIGVLNCVDPSVPRNDGSFRRVRVLLRENCIVGIPRFPASCSMATSNMTNRVINATQRAFSLLGDNLGLAEGGASMGAGFAVVSGIDDRRGNTPYVNQFIMGNNGGPAAANCDGWITYGMPDCAATVLVDSVEVVEQKYPVLFRSSKLLPDSGGAGRFRGAPAGEVVFGPRRTPMTVAYFAEMHVTPPAGTAGGDPGSCSYVHKVLKDGSIEPLPPIGLVELQPLEFVRGAESGGGGYGDPRLREPERVLEDVLEGWVTPEAARRCYGVVIRPGRAGGSADIDRPATEHERSQGRGRAG
jgi:N-methylhydantoinase B